MFRVTVNLFLEVLALSIVFAFGTNQHLICKTVEDVFTDVSISSPASATPRHLHGPPGKRGNPGVKGESGIPGLKGERGLPGIVDPQNVEKIVEEKLREGYREILERIERLERLATNLNSSIKVTQEVQHCEEGFFYNGKCYFAIVQRANHQTAKSLCVSEGATAADILNRQHQELAVGHIRSKTTSQKTIWLGMSYTPSTSTLRWSTGEEVPANVGASMRWWSEGSYPMSNSRYLTVGILVDSEIFGFFNYLSSSGEGGVLCEK